MAYQGKPRERTFENVKEFWDGEGTTRGGCIDACIRDNEFRDLEIGYVRGWIKGKDSVLDLACGNGYCTRFFAKDVKEIIGADYSETLIRAAQEKIEGLDEPIRNNTRFEVASALSLPYNNNSFDAVIAQRLLVNLPEEGLQKKAVQEIYRVLKPNGLYIFSEATFQGHDSLNSIRNKFGLTNMERHWHNLYVNEASLLPFINQYFEVRDSNRFGLYHFISKVLNPLLVHPNEPKFDDKINAIAHQLAEKMPKIGELEKASHHLCMVLEKKS